jgi:tRNA1Val (adenine37-N6)-methyltransferase
MSNPYFQFKQFTVFHDQCAMKVGTDGVLLGAWTDVCDADRILDVGTGSGLIAIMLAQRCGAFIDAVEIDADACKQARENANACRWNNRIGIHHASFQQFERQSDRRYDVIVSNPPYFKASLKSPVKTRSLARHNESLTYESLLFGSSHMLTQKGRLALIIPAELLDAVIREACFYDLSPIRLMKVRSLPGKEYSRCLVEFSCNNTSGCRESTLTLHDEHSKAYSEEFKALTADFYLIA